MKGETLPHFRNRARLVDDQTGNGGRFIVRQIPVHDSIEVADRNCAVDIDRAVGLTTHTGHSDIVLVGDVADDLLANIFQRDQALDPAEFVYHHRAFSLTAAT